MSEPDYNAEVMDPDLWPMAVAELRSNRKAVRRLIGIRLGYEKVYADLEITQMVDISHKLVEHTNNLLSQTSSMLSEIGLELKKLQLAQEELRNKSLPMAYKIGATIAAGIAFLIGFVA